MYHFLQDAALESVEAILSTPFQIGTETLEAFEKRMSRARAIMGLRGVAYNQAAVVHAIDAGRLADQFSKSGDAMAGLNIAMEAALDDEDWRLERAALRATT